MNKIAFIIIFFLGFKINAQEKIEKLIPNDFEKSIRLNNTFPLIDLRTKNEFDAGHIKKSIHVDYQKNDFEEYFQKVFDKKKPIYLYCQTGQKSSDAALFLSELGYSKITVLKGGFEKWIANSKPYKSSEKTFVPLGFITKENYNALIRENKWILVDYYADWCAPCKKMAPTLMKIDDERSDLTVVKIDADKNTSLVESFEVSEIPTLILYKNGRQIWRSTGIVTEEEIKSKLY